MTHQLTHGSFTLSQFGFHICLQNILQQTFKKNLFTSVSCENLFEIAFKQEEKR